MYTRMHACMYTYMHACMHGHATVPALLLVSTSSWYHLICMYTCMYVYTYIHMYGGHATVPMLLLALFETSFQCQKRPSSVSKET